MSFTLADFKAAADAKYGGLVIDDAPNGPLTIRNAMAVTDDAQRAALKACIETLNATQAEAPAEGDVPATTDANDLDRLPEVRTAVVELLAVLADRSDDLRAYLTDQPLTVVLAIKDAWEESSAPKAS